MAGCHFGKGLIRVRGTLARVDGELIVTEPKTAKSKRTLHLSSRSGYSGRGAAPEEGPARAGSAWTQTGYIYAHVSPDVSAQAMDTLGAALDG